ncbi:hypothetical protein BCR32DRAFT_284168 [Anaeromyces robustus]|uniref:Uncharacterized protein n=1 Tax=Anaeromyces robustus TaxID=1754192 RepID=A0A1Y1WT91_9FUNG|nr:hypothetical protein BCR32DRAFT_284168 [Anaeromyces robustus]|eukprot:ORX76456.1 hypothetical protein BCR32DRAFT_284168 [Anaeromyces robustus]
MDKSFVLLLLISMLFSYALCAPGVKGLCKKSDESSCRKKLKGLIIIVETDNGKYCYPETDDCFKLI